MVFIIDWINKGTNFVEGQWNKAINDGVEDILQEFVEDWEYSTSNWSNPPKFVIDKREKAIWTNDMRFIWICWGTRDRFRYMKKGWISKSSPGHLGTRSGWGTPGRFGRPGKPGIQARGWDVLSFERQLSDGIIPGAIGEAIIDRGWDIFRD